MNEEALRAAYDSASSRMNMTFDAFREYVKEWEVLPVKVDGKLVGAVLMSGPEIHACIKPEGFGKWLTRSVLRNTVYKLLRIYGYATTHVELGNLIGEAFVSRLGFKKEGEAWVLRQH